jgi:hypothetical protein
LAIIRPVSGVTLPQTTDTDNVPGALATLMDGVEPQLLLRFASASERDALLTAPQRGQVAWLDNPGKHTKYDGAAWVNLNPRMGTPVDYHGSSGGNVPGNTTVTITSTTITTVAPESLLFVSARQVLGFSAVLTAGNLKLSVDGATSAPGWTSRRISNQGFGGLRDIHVPGMFVQVTAGSHSIALSLTSDAGSGAATLLYEYDIYAVEIA